MRDKKLAEAWVKANPWTSDYDGARKRASDSGKPVFAYFTRSNTDRAPGTALEGEFSTAEFKAFAADVVLFMHLTTGIEGEKHGNLASDKGAPLPSIAILDSQGGITARVRGGKVANFQEAIKASKAFLDLKARQESLAPAEAFKLLMSELDFERVTPSEAEARHKALTGLTKEQDKQLSDLIAAKKAVAADKQIMALVREKNPRSDAEAAAVGKAYYAMYQAGVRPTGDEPFQVFYILLSKHGLAAKDPGIFEIALRALKGKFGSNPRAKTFLEQREKELEQLKQDAGSRK